MTDTATPAARCAAASPPPPPPCRSKTSTSASCAGRDFNPGAETGWHRRGFLFVVVPVTDGAPLVEPPDDSTATATLEAGRAYARPAGVEHNVVNAGPGPPTLVETATKAWAG